MEETRNTSSGQSTQEFVDIVGIFRTLWSRRKVFYWTWPITFVLSTVLILCVPRRYTSEVILAPEIMNGSSSGSLQSLASSFGFDMRNMTSTDAIYPQIYPDLVSSPDYLVQLFDIPVQTADSSFNGTYYNYLLKKHKQAFWKRWSGYVLSWIMPKEPSVNIQRSSKRGVDVFCMSKAQWKAIGLMRKSISCSVDKKTEVIKLTITAQDKIVCAVVADSACAALQTFITDYRTQKARTDIVYYEQVMKNALEEYHEASERYIRYVDGHSGMKLEQYRIEAQNLETEMQLKQSAFISFQKQYLATQARLQENTPAFTVFQSASIPVKASGPKRLIFVLAMLILATITASCILCKEQLWAIMSTRNE